jgi:2-keto-4-pentenoate hydratase/2-oxohepta-3-ene-1,7-dioic acid hydratase in catechol pathway
MKLIRWGQAGQEKPGLELPDGGRVDASSFGEDYGETFFATGGLDRLAAWAKDKVVSAPRLAAGTRLGPALPRPSKLVCIGLNYADHARETKAKTPTEPVIFFKATSAWHGPDDDVVLPRGSEKTDWEVELAVVIGKATRYVKEAEAMQHVAGFALHNDYSERALQLERGGQWVKGKSADTFAPFGPFLATRDELPNFQSLPMWLNVNGESRQKSSTANMIFQVPFLVAYVSEFMTLLPGDVISTGTPAGVALGMETPVYLKEGDVVELGIDGLGRQRQRIVSAR